MFFVDQGRNLSMNKRAEIDKPSTIVKLSFFFFFKKNIIIVII